jgi:hypothetical protein
MTFPIHNRFPKLMSVVGRLLVAYGELELDLMNCIQVARGYDLNSTLKAMFRVRGETNRLDIADALGQEPYDKRGLSAEFKQMMDAVRYCLRIRNKYAHAYWHDPGTELCYLSLEELAKEDIFVKDLTGLTFFYIDEPLLLRQEAYFEYARDVIRYVNHEGRVQAKEFASQPFRLPAAPTPPPFYVRKS